MNDEERIKKLEEKVDTLANIVEKQYEVLTAIHEGNIHHLNFTDDLKLQIENIHHTSGYNFIYLVRLFLLSLCKRY